jgi:DNA-binding response OmpR family regulator
MSGYEEHEIAQRFEGKGLAGFVQKPFDPDTLIARLQAFEEPTSP